MNDTISRKAAIDALERIFDRCEEIEAHLSKGDPDRVGYKMYPDWLTVWKYLHQLPSAQQWIPVSERLPEVGRNVLMSVGKGLYTAEGELKHDGTWVQYRWSANIENVDAWAEMPEPWRGEER